MDKVKTKSAGVKNESPTKSSKSTSPQVDFNDPVVISIGVALLVILLTLLIFLKRSKKSGRSIVFVGPVDSGKTALISHVVSGQGVETLTSVIPNEYEYTPLNGKAPVILKDLPGHERVRGKFWEANKNGLRGVACIVDSSGGSKAIRESAEVLYTVLSDPIVKSSRPNILIFANKQDMPSAKGCNIIQAQLERELTTLRMTKSAGLQTIGNSQDVKTIGKPDQDFEFAHVSPLKVEFAEGSGSKSDPELESILEWISKVA